MSSLRNNPRAGDPSDTYLDAARDCILDVGWRRTTLTEVARRAGVSRMTIYRTWTDMETLLGDLMTREWTGVVQAAVAAEDPRRGAVERMVEGIVGTVRNLRDNELFVRDYTRCMLCMKCVQACGDDAQHTYAIAVAGRGFEARIATELSVSLPDSACVFCGNCIGVCPTGALAFTQEFDLRQAGTWDEARQTVTDTICTYCGVGCTLTLRVQDNRIVRVTSPADSSVTGGHLCIKGRFGWGHVYGGK